MNRPVTVAVDRRKPRILGDVVILKRQARAGLTTLCTRCGLAFPTILRRMKRGEALVRNVPRCAPCRHLPYKRKASNERPDVREFLAYLPGSRARTP